MSEIEEDNNVRGIIVNPEIINKPLVDLNGNLWLLEELKNQPDNSLAKGMLFTKRIRNSVDEEVKKKLINFSATTFKAYIEKDFKSALHEAVKSADPMIRQCLSNGEANFRKSFVEALSKEGTKVFSQLIGELLKDVSKNFSKANSSADEGITSLGVLPPGLRMKWCGNRRGQEVVLFLIEQPPQVRTVNIGNSFRRLAFPWIRFYVMFVGGVYAYLFVFYGKEAIASEKSKLFYPGLPHFWNRWPYDFCVGYGLPETRINTEWWPTIIDHYFWEKSFVLPMDDLHNNHQIYQNWYDMTQRMPELSTLDKWEKTSQISPEKLVSLPWRAFEKSAGEFGRDVVKWYMDNNMGADAKSKPDVTAEQNRIINKFSDRIKEEIHFLTNKFVISPDFQKEAVEFTNEKIKICKDEFVANLSGSCEKIAKEIVMKCLDAQSMAKSK